MRIKKIFSFGLIVLSIAFLVACQKSSSTSVTTQTSESTTTTEPIVISDIHDSPEANLDTRPAADNSGKSIIIDNGNKEFTYVSARLKTSTEKSSFVGNDYIEGANGTAFSGTWTPNIVTPGYYKIYMIWPNNLNQNEKVTVEIGYEGGNNQDITKVVNQNINGGYYVFIGTYYLSVGNGNYVKIYGSDSKVVLADAVLFDLSLKLEDLQSETPLKKVADFTPGSQTHLLKEKTGEFRLSVDGELFFAKGICGTEDLELMAQAGVNAARTYSTAALDNGALLDRAEELGIKIMIGLWMNHESATFNYKDHPEAVQTQFENLKKEVDKYKDHPALLAWAVGNEVDKSTSANPIQIYNAMNDLAKYIHEVDPYHPTTAVLAGASEFKISYIKRYVPHIDIISINTYKQIGSVNSKLQAWNGPYMVTEYALNQPMETTLTTTWGSLIEPNDEEKAALYSQRYLDYMYGLRDQRAVGSFAFKDSGAFRVTHTWYNLIINDLKTPTYFAMKEAWTGETVNFQIPIIDSILIDGESQLKSVVLTPSTKSRIEVSVKNAIGENLTYKYEIRKDVSISINTVPSVLTNINYEAVPGKPNEMFFTTPNQPGLYRLYVYASNDRGQVTTSNFPFKVEGEPFVLENEQNVNIMSTYSEGFTKSGTWSTSTNRPYNGQLTLFTRELGAYAQFTPTLTEAGKYRIYLYNLSEGMGQSDDSEIQIEIYFNSNQKETLTINITTTTSGWFELGDYDFVLSGAEYIRILKMTDTSKVVRATAVAFLPISES